MAAIELQIRIGQADETLHEIRTIVGHKSFVFRKELRQSKGQKQTLRSWNKIHTIDGTLRAQCRVYAHCRAALDQLGASQKVLDRYQKLERAHVVASTTIEGENIIGDRSPNLSWIWTLDVQGDAASTDWLEECMSELLPSLINSGCIDIRTVYRVHWLRLRARADRAREERIRVKAEMLWTLSSYVRIRRKWQRREKNCKGRSGHEAYARKQASLWGSFYDNGRLLWRSVVGVLPPM